MQRYVEIGPPGMLARMNMDASLHRADEAMISGDVAAMLRAYKDLQGYTD